MDESKVEQIYNNYLRNIVYRMVGNGSTYSTQLERACFKIFGRKFRGVFPSDRIPKLNEMVPYAILNVDKSGEPGSHWIAVAKEGGKLYYYDSFGRNSKELIPSLHRSGNGIVVDTDDDAEQRVEQEDCGARCVSFLLVFDKYGSKEALKI